MTQPTTATERGQILKSLYRHRRREAKRARYHLKEKRKEAQQRAATLAAIYYEIQEAQENLKTPEANRAFYTVLGTLAPAGQN